MSTNRSGAMPAPSAVALAGASMVLLTAACQTSSTPTPRKDAPPPVAVSAPSSSSPSASAATVREAPPEPVPTLVPEEFKPEGHPEAVYGIQGAVVVTEGPRVGRVVGEAIEWVGEIPKGSIAIGPNRITAVLGRWPDAVDVLFTTTNGRALQPTYWPLTGKGKAHTIAPGGGAGWITGVAMVGESTIVAGSTPFEGVTLVTVRGPKLSRIPLAALVRGCTEEEVPKPPFGPPLPAIQPTDIGGTPGGTLLSFGPLCAKRGPAVEIWDKDGKERVVDLSPLLTAKGGTGAVLQGKGDELWIRAGGQVSFLRYADEKFEPVPPLDKRIDLAFVSMTGRLHALTGQTIHRYEGGAWKTIGEIAWPSRIDSMAASEDGTLFATLGGHVVRLRKGAGTAFREGCATPFVFLYDVAADNAPDFTFPTTRKALSTFPEVAAIGLVDFRESGARRLGVTVTSKAQGEAVIAHVKAAMPKEEPRLLCYEPKAPRKLALP